MEKKRKGGKTQAPRERLLASDITSRIYTVEAIKQTC